MAPNIIWKYFKEIFKNCQKAVIHRLGLSREEVAKEEEKKEKGEENEK